MYIFFLDIVHIARIWKKCILDMSISGTITDGIQHMRWVLKYSKIIKTGPHFDKIILNRNS